MTGNTLKKFQYVKLKNMKLCDENNDGNRDLLGLLERPNLPLSVQEYKYKIFIIGGAGVGKSFFISWVTGMCPCHMYMPTPGIQTAVSHYPAYLLSRAPKEVLFTLQFWESGASSKILHSGMLEDCPEGVDALILLFSASDKKSFELLSKMIADFSVPNAVETPCIFAVCIECSLQEKPSITQKDIIHFEEKWKVPILFVPFISAELELQSLSGLKEVLISTVCESLWLRDQNLVLKNSITG